MKVVLFDGYCTICNTAVDWLMAHDKQNVFKYSSLQGKFAREAKVAPTGGFDPDTIVYLREGQIFERSDAVLKIAQELGGLYLVLAQIAFIFPKSLRDFIYRWVAKNRYRWFARREVCRVPTANERIKFID